MSNVESGLQKALVAERRKRQAAELEAWVRKAYAAYRKSSDIKADLISATKAGFSGSGYSLELLPSEDNRVLWDDNIGNLYDSPGLIISLPKISDDDWDEDDSFFDNAIEALDIAIEDVIAEQRYFILNGDNDAS